MKQVVPLALILLIAQARAVIITIEQVTCYNLSLAVNATLAEFSTLPEELQITIENQTRTANLNLSTMPEHGSDLMLQTTVDFNYAFVLPSGIYNMTMDLMEGTTDEASLNDLISFVGCYSGADSSSTPLASSVGTATATISTYPYAYTYHSAIGVPTHGIIDNPPQEDTSSGLSTGAKIGITIGVLVAALVAVLAAMALLYRRRRQNDSDSSPRSKARRYADGRWLNEDRNSAELKEIQQTQA